jgi:hypothetical protein
VGRAARQGKESRLSREQREAFPAIRDREAALLIKCRKKACGMPLIDLLIATEPVASEGANSVPLPGTSEECDRICIKGFDVVTLSRLWAILGGKAWDASLVDAFPLIYTGSRNGPWVFRVPADLLDQLERLPDAELPRVSNAWSRTEELSRFHMEKPEMVKEVLEDIVSLVRRGKDQGKGVYLWCSL